MEVPFAGTVTEPGTVRSGELLERTTAVPVAAAFESVTVQLLEEFAPRLVGLQASEATSTGATRLIVALAELLLYVAVMVAV